MFFIIRHFVIGFEILAPKLIDLKTALVHIEVYVALFKIRRVRLLRYVLCLEKRR